MNEQRRKLRRSLVCSPLHNIFKCNKYLNEQTLASMPDQMQKYLMTMDQINCEQIKNIHLNWPETDISHALKMMRQSTECQLRKVELNYQKIVRKDKKEKEQNEAMQKIFQTAMTPRIPVLYQKLSKPEPRDKGEPKEQEDQQYLKQQRQHIQQIQSLQQQYLQHRQQIFEKEDRQNNAAYHQNLLQNKGFRSAIEHMDWQCYQKEKSGKHLLQKKKNRPNPKKIIRASRSARLSRRLFISPDKLSPVSSSTPWQLDSLLKPQLELEPQPQPQPSPHHSPKANEFPQPSFP